MQISSAAQARTHGAVFCRRRFAARARLAAAGEEGQKKSRAERETRFPRAPTTREEGALGAAARTRVAGRQVGAAARWTIIIFLRAPGIPSSSARACARKTADFIDRAWRAGAATASFFVTPQDQACSGALLVAPVVGAGRPAAHMKRPVEAYRGRAARHALLEQKRAAQRGRAAADAGRPGDDDGPGGRRRR